MAEAKNDKAKGNSEEYALYGGPNERSKALVAKGTKAEIEKLEARYWKNYKDAKVGVFLEIVKL